MKIVTRAAPGSLEWHQARRGCITASRAANILAGQSDLPGYKSPRQEWEELKAELNGTAPAIEEDDREVDEERNEFMQWGLDSEPLHRAKLGALIGEELEPFNAILEDDEYPWLRASPDCITRTVRELKAVCGGAAAKWAQGVPYLHQCQLAVQQRVSGLKEDGIVSGFVSRGFKPPAVQFERFDLTSSMEHFVMGALEAFWDSVQRDIPPEPSAGDYDALRTYARPRIGKRCKLPWSLWDERQALEARREAVKAFENDEDALKAKIIAVMGDAELGIFEDGSGYTFKSTTRNYKAQEARVVVTKPSLKWSEKAAWK